MGGRARGGVASRGVSRFGKFSLRFVEFGESFRTEAPVTLVGRDLLDQFCRAHADLRRPLQAWIKEVEAATWQTPQDIKNRYRSVDFRPGNRVIFDLKGNHYRLVAIVRYHGGILLVEWIGTHAEYDKRSI
jgi:mRNA interferase HigB